MTPRGKFLLLVTIFLLPTVLSSVAYFYFPPNKTTNYGSLVSPLVALPPESMRRLDVGNDTGDVSVRGKWLLITRDSGRCESACRKKLYAMRQARLILGRDQDRVQRIVLVDDDIVPSAEMQATSDGTIWIAAKSLSWLRLLPVPPGDESGRGAIYVADTLGNVFMRYGEDPDIRKLATDLQRVLKASQIG